MKALICDILGLPEALRIVDAPDPVAAKGEALVEVSHAALNFFDLLLIAGKYQVKPALPFSPAGEFSGRIAGLGPGAGGFAVGQRVCGYAGYGCAREKLAIPIANLVAIPDDLSLDKAAGLSITYGTTMHAFKQRGDLTEGTRKAAADSLAAADRKTADYEAQIRDARSEIYKEQEELRRQWLDEQASQIDGAHDRALKQVQSARQQLAAEAESARQSLDVSVGVLADQIATAVLAPRGRA